MHTDMSSTRWSIGAALLGAVLVFGFYGIVINATEGDRELFEQDALYIEECGACHLAYPPGLLPVQSWRGIMSDLEDHLAKVRKRMKIPSHISAATSNGLRCKKANLPQ